MLPTTPTLSVNLTTGLVSQSDPIPVRNTTQVTLTGTGSFVNTNMRLALYRLSNDLASGTLCATCSSFTGAVNAFTGSLNLNTSEMVTAFSNLEMVRQAEKLRFELFIYDNTTDYYTIWDSINVSYEHALVAGTPAAVTPITTGSLVWGDIRLYAGSLYKYSVTDGLWYKWIGAGAGTQIHEEFDTTGISLP